MDKETLTKAKGFWGRTEGYRFMFLVALIFDGLSAFPWVGMIFFFLGYATLWLWMEIEGMSPGLSKKARHNAKKAGSMLAEGGAGVLGFGIVPGILFWTYFIVSEHVEENTDKEQKTIEETQRNLTKKEERTNDQLNKKARKQKQRVKTSAFT